MINVKDQMMWKKRSKIPANIFLISHLAIVLFYGVLLKYLFQIVVLWIIAGSQLTLGDFLEKLIRLCVLYIICRGYLGLKKWLSLVVIAGAAYVTYETIEIKSIGLSMQYWIHLFSLNMGKRQLVEELFWNSWYIVMWIFALETVRHYRVFNQK